jgi:hypothetical protein
MHGQKENAGGARAFISNGEIKWFYRKKKSRPLVTVQSTLGVGGCGREMLASATFSLQFARASAATLPQKEKNSMADVQRGRAIISGFMVQW